MEIKNINGESVWDLGEIKDCNLESSPINRINNFMFNNLKPVSVIVEDNETVQKINDFFKGQMNLSKNKYNIESKVPVSCRWHKKKRINKKLMKRYGHPNFVLRKVILKDCKMKENPDGSYEFVKDGDSLYEEK